VLRPFFPVAPRHVCRAKKPCAYTTAVNILKGTSWSAVSPLRQNTGLTPEIGCPAQLGPFSCNVWILVNLFQAEEVFCYSAVKCRTDPALLPSSHVRNWDKPLIPVKATGCTLNGRRMIENLGLICKSRIPPSVPSVRSSVRSVTDYVNICIS